MFKSLEPGSCSWAAKTYEEVKDIAQEDGSILLVPVGSLEQHGPHMPTITDSLLADAVCALGAERVQEEIPILTTPPVWTGYSPHHLEIGGSVSLQFDNLMDTLDDLVTTALRNDFNAVMMVNGHGGNANLISSAVQVIGDKNKDADVLGITYWMLSNPEIDEIRESNIGGFSHAGEFETSLMMHLRPELVDEEKMETEYYKPIYDLSRTDLVKPGILSAYESFEHFTDTGIAGDPTLASKEKGSEIYALLGEKMEELLYDIHERNSETRRGS